MPEFNNCTTLLDPKGGERLFTDVPDEVKNGPTIYSPMPAQIGILCGLVDLFTFLNTFNSRYLKVHPNLLISESKFSGTFSGPRKFTLGFK